MTTPDQSLLHAIMDVGEEMQNSGAEISRVEDSISRMCASYGVRRVHSFTITGNMIVTLETDDGAVLTQTRRIRPGVTDFTRLDRLNYLSRYICAHQPSADEIHARFRDVTSIRPMSARRAYAAAAMTAGAFALFFGGAWRDGLAAALLGLLIEFLTRRPFRRLVNPILYLFLIAFLTGCGAALLPPALGMRTDKILIGCIMLTIPGLSITNAVRDLLSGDTISGLARLCECLLQAGGIAGGIGLSILFFGGGAV